MLKTEIKKTIKISPNGPYIISGSISLNEQTIIVDKENNPIKYTFPKKLSVKKEYALCRCGNSKNKPFCDGSHVITKFKGKETANLIPYLKQAKTYSGSNLILKDVESFCSAARFCHLNTGTWNLTQKSNITQNRKEAIREAQSCPSGRLTIYDKKTNKPIELKQLPSITILQDPAQKVSGPLWIKGKIKIISANNQEYEPRNNVTLCRCGKSKNKPFCDGAHISAKFNDKK
ncbi:CDGSH iron-sulfur domain-containing protein [Candidatus Woesearchaeota archaeon]|nr:CDGSH iron-sulfur domain-containing protein [Candidatus Woesearchaeota archaeon]